ncbi:MAG: hypothetical protein DWQ10_00870 [Calditrichaeota bacterium]|nr:MAG: hypothetical protein DWQ10_00870 [Calditrichota bacterium]
MKLKSTLLPLGLALILILALLDFILGLFIQNTQEKTYRVVQSGESISLLALREYRTYNSFVKEILNHANQHLADQSALVPGDTVYFPSLTKMELDIQVYKKPGISISTPREELKNRSGEAFVTWVEGRVLYKSAPDTNWRHVENNLILKTGDTVLTGDSGRVEIALDRKSVLRLDRNTEFMIHFFNVPVKKEIHANFEITTGELWFAIDQFLDKKSLIYCRFPAMSLRLLDARFRASGAPGSSNRVYVYDGIVEVRRREESAEIREREIEQHARWVQKVRANHHLHITADRQHAEPEKFSARDKTNAWVAWNRKRDTIFTQR